MHLCLLLVGLEQDLCLPLLVTIEANKNAWWDNWWRTKYSKFQRLFSASEQQNDLVCNMRGLEAGWKMGMEIKMEASVI